MKNRFISLFLAFAMLLTFAVPVNASITNLTDYTSTEPAVESPAQPDVKPTEPVSNENPVEKSTAEESTETPVKDLQSDSDPQPERSELDSPPDSFTFEAVAGGGISPMAAGMVRAMSAGSTTIRMTKIPDIVHSYPFGSTTGSYNGYVFVTADGRAAYCIEPARFNSTNNTVVTGSKTYGGLSASQQSQIAKAIAASGGSTSPYTYMACQAIIWEICYGQSAKSGNVYAAVIGANAGKLSGPYDSIRSKMSGGGQIPSFMSTDPENPTQHTMTDNGGTWSIELTNTNNQVNMNASDFQTRSQLNFSVNGNRLTVTSPTQPDGDSYTAWFGSGGGSALIFWNSNQQTKATYDTAVGIPGNGYMVFAGDWTPIEPDDPPPPPPEEEPDPKVGYLLIQKYDGTNHLPLGGAVFRIESADYVNDAFVVPYGGKAIVIPIPEGQDSVEVTVTEVTAPTGYVLDGTPQTVTVTAGEQVNIAEVGFVNFPEECSLTIFKYAKGSRTPLAGARFRIRYADPNVSAQVWTETTNAAGEIRINLPAAGTLMVEELEAPAGYVIGVNTTVEVVIARGEQKRVDISNDPKSQLVVTKRDNQSGQTLAGAVIRATLLRAHTAPYNQNVVRTLTTGADGRAVFTDLIPGEYRVEETSPPQYYEGTTQVHTVSIFDGTTAAVEVEFRNDPWTGLTIRKVDATNGNGLAGALFKLYRGTQAHPADYLGDFQSNENGTVIVQNLEPGFYTIVETQAPHGYFVDTEHNVQTVEVKPDAHERNLTVVFRNLPKPKLQIIKVDTKTGARLSGAMFRVAQRASAEFVDVTTGADGTVLLENLNADWYQVTEIRAPSGYVLNDTPQDVELIAGETAVVTAQNSKQPNLTLRKVDEQTGVGLAGAVFRITADGAASYRDVTTGTGGVIVHSGLTPGWYTVVERKAPAGYLLDDTPQYVEVKAGEDTEIVVKNRHKPALKIVKLDETTRQPLAGVKFSVAVKNGKPVGEFVTDGNGEILLEDIEPATYVITETEAPAGYIRKTESAEVLVEWGKVAEITFFNEPQNPLLIKKVDAATGEPLADATFLVTKINGELVGEYTTGRNGYITVTGVLPGWYTVKEVRSPVGYILDETPKNVELKLDEPAVVEFENKPLAGLHIKKIDAKTKEPLSGAKFLVAEKNGNRIGEYATDAHGTFQIPQLTPGWYTVTELEAPTGYLLDTVPQDVELRWNTVKVVEFTNERLSPLQIKKVDAETGAPLSGALFRVTKSTGDLVGEFTSGKDGFINVPELVPGTYIVSELRSPDGYALDETAKTVTVKENQATLVTFENKRLPGLQVRKTDSVTNDPLSGARFTVAHMNGETVGDFVTNEAGFFVVPDLPAGWYTVWETSAPKGYERDSTPQNVELKSGKTAVVQFANVPLAGLQVQKIDSVTGEAMSGVELTVTKQNGEMLGKFTTDENGLIFVSDLVAGTYVVTETATLDGYKLDRTPKTVEVKSGRLNRLVLENQPYPVVKIVKTDAETGAPLKGVSFALFDKDGKELGTFQTNHLGNIILTGMDAGVYSLQEVEALEGYVLDETVREVNLDWGKTTVVEVQNVPKATLSVKKVDKETGKPLADATFLMYDSKNNLLGEFVTDENGLIAFDKTLNPAEYRFKETKAPKGYVLDETVHKVTVKAGETVELVVENVPERGKIAILKVSADDNPITKTKTGTPLAGAVFEITNDKKEVVATLTTDENGKTETPDLPLGKYGVQEIAAPEYYFTEGKMFYAELKLHGDLVAFEVENSSVKPDVHVTKTGNEEVIPGDTMYYDFADIVNASNVPLDDFYWRDELPDEVRLQTIHTGTWTEMLTYSVTYKTNRSDKYKTLKTELSTDKNHTLDCSADKLKLAVDEYITEIRFAFGTVPVGFTHDVTPRLLVQVLEDVGDDVRIVNDTEVGGRIGEHWVTETDAWVTVTFGSPDKELPKTGW